MLDDPEFTRPDARHPQRTLAFGRIDEFGGRWLRVVYEPQADRDRIVTVFFDRKAKEARLKLSYDRETDALYMRISSAPIVESEEVRPGVAFDFDADGHIVAIEILDAAKQVPADVFASIAAE